MNHFEDVVNCCKDLLQNFPDAKPMADYANNRLSKSAQEKFSFGYFPSNKNLLALISIVGENKLVAIDVIYDKVIEDGISRRNIKRGALEDHNLIMPYRDVYGNIVALVGRTILDDNDRASRKLPKYKNTSFTKGDHLFGLYESKNSIIQNNLAFVVEGQFDCITAIDKGLTNIVALGSSAMSFEQFALLTRYTNNIILMLDNDTAGREGTERIIKHYSKYANIKKAKLPRGFKDIDEYLTDNSVESLSLILK